MAFASCIITSILLTKYNSIATVSIILTTLMCENPHATVESNTQLHFTVNVWCAVVDDQLIGPFILEIRLTGEVYLRFLQEELPRLLEDVPLNKRGGMYFQNYGAPPHKNFLHYRFPGRWIGCGGPYNWPARSPDLSPLDYCVWGWMKELVYSVKVVTRDALLCRILDAAHRIRKSAEAASSNSRGSQPSGSLCCGRRWHFRKPALSTDQFKLKVISRS